MKIIKIDKTHKQILPKSEGYMYRTDLTSDVAIEAFADTKKELLVQAALGMSSVICNLSEISPQKSVTISVKGSDFSDLMFQWLQNIIALVDTDGLFCCKFEITSLSLTSNTMTAVCYGEAITPEKGGTVVKAVTYHDFKIFQKLVNKKKLWCVWYCVDI